MIINYKFKKTGLGKFENWILFDSDDESDILLVEQLCFLKSQSNFSNAVGQNLPGINTNS